MKLSSEPRYSYSPKEKEVFKLLATKPRTSVSIIEQMYEDPPLNGRQIIIGVLKSLQQKVKMNREPFMIERTERAGPIPVSFWIKPTRRNS